MENFIDTLHFHLNENELPGAVAHSEMSPMIRVQANPRKIPSARKSAVLLMLHERNREMFITLIERTSYNGVHSKQMAFPGGRYEKEDDSFQHTALRETEEEIGVSTENISIIGKLSDIYIPPSNFLVYPYVGFHSGVPEYNLDPKEVKSVTEFSTKTLLSPRVITTSRVSVNSGIRLNVPSFVIDNKVVWGATACILNEFRKILENV